MQKKAPLTVFFSTVMILKLFASSPNSPVGRWTTIDESGAEKSVIQIYSVGDKIFGKIVELKKKAKDGSFNCDLCEGSFKNKPLIDLVILKDLIKDGDTWTGGTILDPKNDKVYNCNLTIEDGGKKLQVRGYIGFSLMGRTQTWKENLDAPKLEAPAIVVSEKVLAPAAGSKPDVVKPGADDKTTSEKAGLEANKKTDSESAKVTASSKGAKDDKKKNKAKKIKKVKKVKKVEGQ